MNNTKNADSASSSSSLHSSPAFVVLAHSEYELLKKQLNQGTKKPKSQNSSDWPSTLVKPPEMASILSISLNQLDRLRATGAVPSVKIGGSRRYSPADVLAAIKEAGE